MDLTNLTIKKARALLDSGEISSVELTKYYLEKIKTENQRLNAFLTIAENFAINQAQEADKKIKVKIEKLKNGVKLDSDLESPILGVPYCLKDSFCTKDVRTTAGAKYLENFIPPYNATIVQRLEDAGGVLLGKANMDAWGHGSSTENSDFGPTKNPHDITRVPGGSSGGSAAAVAADLCVFAIGEDTGGSIRHPAGLCGIHGLKVTYGKVPRYGCIALASSLDTVGPMAKSSEDIETVLNIIKGTDGFDATVMNLEEKVKEKEVIISQENTETPLNGIKFAFPKDFVVEGMDEEVKKAYFEIAEKIKNLGGTVGEVSLPSTKYGMSIYYIICWAETSTNLARYDGIRFGNHVETGKGWLEDVIVTRTQNLGQEAKRRIMLGTYVLSSGYYDAYYGKAQKVRSKLIKEFNDVFANYDAIISPVTPGPAFKLGENTSDPIKMYLEDLYTVTANIVGITSLAIPYKKFENGMPLGMQIMGPKWSEGMICEIGNVLDK
ncbi:MAG: Asp-tRNA(Asn)/Glu-tRNA(Gln) amidotransferase subunit GatA [bacterium]